MSEFLMMWLELLLPVLILVFCISVTATIILGGVGIVLIVVALIRSVLLKR